MYEFTLHFKTGALCYLKVEPCEPDKTLEIPEDLNTTDYNVPKMQKWWNLFKRIVGCISCSQSPFLLV